MAAPSLLRLRPPHSRWLPMAEEGTPPPEAELRAELAAMKVKALKKRAKEAGVDEEKIEDADDADDVKSTVIELIVAAERGATLEKLRAELSAMKVTALKKRAKEVGVDEEKLEDADDEDDVKGTVIGLILEQAQPSATAEPPPETQREQELQKMREELEGMKVRALKKRAKEIGVNEEKLGDVDYGEDVKGTIIALILDHPPEGISEDIWVKVKGILQADDYVNEEVMKIHKLYDELKRKTLPLPPQPEQTQEKIESYEKMMKSRWRPYFKRFNDYNE